MTIEIKYKCPSWNDFYMGKHWSIRKKLADEIHELVMFSVRSNRDYLKPKEVFKTCNIFFEIEYKGNRRHDPDNCCVKLFIDGLVKEGIIEDDNSDIVKEIAIRCNNGEQDKVIIHINEYVH